MRMVLLGLLPWVVQLALPTGTFVVVPGESQVTFHVRDNRGGFSGQTDQVSGTVVVRAVDGGYTATVEARVDARTMRTGASLRDAQMRSATFLHTREFPFIRFEGTATAERVSGELFPAMLRGRLTVRTVSREVVIPLTVRLTGTGYTAQGETTVRFTEFGLPVPRFLIFVAEDLILIRIAAVLRPQ
jgi:polyisoprenoid-binding protein YceI